jgi:hypothetical protein
MKSKSNLKYLFLFGGLLFIFVAMAVLWTGGSFAYYGSLLGIGILFKAIFLGFVFREKGFRWNFGLTLILIGVVMIFLSLLFKTIFPFPVVRNVLFYGAIAMKVSGLVLVIAQKGGRGKVEKN